MSILERFTVVDLVKTRSASVVNITGSNLKFNLQTAAELRYPAYVQILINTKDKQFAIRTCKEDASNAVRFSKPEGEQKTPVKFSAIAVVDMIRKMAGWSKEENWNIPGIYFAEENAIVYDIKTAYPPVSKGGGWGVKKEREAAAAAALEEEAEG